MTKTYDSAPETTKHIMRVKDLLADVMDKLIYRASVHDESKLREPEKSMFDSATQKLKSMTYGSEEYKQSLKELGPALNHHYAHNSHHPEHYAMKEDGSVDTEAVEAGFAISHMSLLDLTEMLIDWKAASERHADGDIYKSIEHNRKRFGLTDQLTSILVTTAKEMGW